MTAGTSIIDWGTLVNTADLVATVTDLIPVVMPVVMVVVGITLGIGLFKRVV